MDSLPPDLRTSLSKLSTLSVLAMQEFVPFHTLPDAPADWNPYRLTFNLSEDADEPDYDVFVFSPPDEAQTETEMEVSPKSSADYYAPVYGTRIVAFHFFHDARGETQCIPAFVTAPDSPSKPPQAGAVGVNTERVASTKMKRSRLSRLRGIFARRSKSRAKALS